MRRRKHFHCLFLLEYGYIRLRLYDLRTIFCILGTEVMNNDGVSRCIHPFWFGQTHQQKVIATLLHVEVARATHQKRKTTTQ